MLNQPLTPGRAATRRTRRLATWQEGLLAGGLVALVALGGAIYTQRTAPAAPPPPAATDAIALQPAPAPAAASDPSDAPVVLAAPDGVTEPAPAPPAAGAVQPPAATVDDMVAAAAMDPAAADPPAAASPVVETTEPTAADNGPPTAQASAPAPESSGTAGLADTAPAAAEAASPAAPAEDTRPLVQRITRYRVAPGDGLEAIAQRYGIKVDTLRWANTLPADPDLLYVGQNLTVLPVDGVLYVVRRGDTLESLAARYHVASDDLARANGLKKDIALGSGQQLLIPGGRPLPAPRAPVADWPTPGRDEAQKQRFIAGLVGPAQDSERQTGVPTSVTIAQAIHESDWGVSKLAREANNLFGIKAFDTTDSDKVYWIETWEVVDDEDVMVLDPFRAYASPRESIADHGQFFLRNSRYAAARQMASDPRAFAQAIADAGYATDPAYAAKLIRLMDQYDLYQYDLFASAKPSLAPAKPAAEGELDCHCWIVPVTPLKPADD